MNFLSESPGQEQSSAPSATGHSEPTLRQNRLLAAFPARVLNRLIPALKLVSLRSGMVLLERGDAVRNLYFPNDAVVSLSNFTLSGSSTELSLVGGEGIVGISAFMGGSSLTRAVVQSAGTAYQVEASLVLKEFHRHEDFLHLVLRYMQSVITQTAQTVACNRHHSIDQQLSRWLLLLLDRVPSNRLSMTHELMANMLGVRREGITAAAGRLQKRGIIEYKRGRLTIVNRSELETQSCECYAVVVKESNRLLPECMSTHAGACAAGRPSSSGAQ